MATVPGFLTKTYEIFNSPEYADCCGWGSNGETIIIRKIEQFSKTVLPKYFKHSNFQSFVRQLNMYDFHKTVQDPSNGEFVHPYFKQNRPELLPLIKRKANNRGSDQKQRVAGKHAGSSSASTVSNSLTSMDYSMQQIPDIEALDALEYGSSTDALSSMGLGDSSELANRLSKVEEENRMLKKMFMESHQKNLLMQDRMEKVLKTIYGVFVGQPGAGKALTGRLPSLLLENIPSFAPPPRGLLTDDPHFVASSSPQVMELAADADLGPPVNRGTSFDAAAAAVASPNGELRYLPSFDPMLMSSVLPGEPLVRSHTIRGEDAEFMSDRVTQLPDESSFHGATVPVAAASFAARAPSPQPVAMTASTPCALPPHALGLRMAASTPNGVDDGDSSWGASSVPKRRSYSAGLEGMDGCEDWEPSVPPKKLRPPAASVSAPASASASTPASASTSAPMDSDALGAAGSLQNVDLVQADTRQFIDLLNRNQSTTLNRLDSLEQTIATLMETMDYESAEGDAMARSAAAGPSPEVSSGAVGILPSS